LQAFLDIPQLTGSSSLACDDSMNIIGIGDLVLNNVIFIILCIIFHVASEYNRDFSEINTFIINWDKLLCTTSISYMWIK